MSQYNRDFYDFIRPGAMRSAEIIIPMVYGLLENVTSVADVGCGEGAWLSVWNKLYPYTEIHGFDGDYVGDENLLIHPDDFTAVDLEQGVDQKWWNVFDLVESLEVAEHLSEDKADSFVDELCDLSRGAILFSAAIPGQNGRGHINEQWPEYWDEKFQANGFRGSNVIRDAIWENPEVENWYKQNTILYMMEDKITPSLEEYFTEPITWRIHPNNTHILPPEDG